MLTARSAWLALLLCAGCNGDEQTAPPASAQATASAAEQPASPRRPIAGPAAFDVTLAGDGAALVWADGEGTIRLQRLDVDGSVAGAAQEVAREKARVRELGAASGGNRVAVVWLSGDARRAAIHSSIGALDSGAFESPSLLTPSEPIELDRRGHLAVSASDDGRLLAFVRGVREPCSDGSSERCASFGLRRLTTTSRPSRPNLVVPTPCERGIIGVAVSSSRWHYGICALEGVQPTVTVFSAQPNPAYAQAQQLLEGCVPGAMTAIGDDIWLVGRCGDRRAGVRVRGVGVSERPRDLGDIAIRCKGRQPVIANRSVRIALDAPTASLSALLPPAVAPMGSRAVWTGKALVVASVVGRKLAVSSHQCRDGVFLRN